MPTPICLLWMFLLMTSIDLIVCSNIDSINDVIYYSLVVYILHIEREQSSIVCLFRFVNFDTFIYVALKITTHVFYNSSDWSKHPDVIVDLYISIRSSGKNCSHCRFRLLKVSYLIINKVLIHNSHTDLYRYSIKLIDLIEYVYRFLL